MFFADVRYRGVKVIFPIGRPVYVIAFPAVAYFSVACAVSAAKSVFFPLSGEFAHQ